MKAIAAVSKSSYSRADELYAAVKRIAVLERYSHQSYSKLKKWISAGGSGARR